MGDGVIARILDVLQKLSPGPEQLASIKPVLLSIVLSSSTEKTKKLAGKLLKEDRER